jgi:glucokinase
MTTGRPAAQADHEIRRRTGDLVGRAVISVAALLDLDRCFVAGSVALGFGDEFFSAANDAVSEHARIAHARGLRIEPSGLRGDGPILGAACVGFAGEEL